MYVFLLKSSPLVAMTIVYHIPESVEDHSEEDEFTEEWYHEWCGRDDFSQQEEEHSQWQ